MTSFHRPQGVEGDEHGQPQRLRDLDRRPGGHPEVRMQQVREIRRQPVPELLGEFGHVCPQVILGQRDWRSGGHVDDVIAGARRDARPEVRAVQTGVDNHVVTLSNQSGGQLGDVHVLTARINAADHRKRAGVFGDQSDAHYSPLKIGFGRRRSGTPESERNTRRRLKRAPEGHGSQNPNHTEGGSSWQPVKPASTMSATT